MNRNHWKRMRNRAEGDRSFIRRACPIDRSAGLETRICRKEDVAFVLGWDPARGEAMEPAGSAESAAEVATTVFDSAAPPPRSARMDLDCLAGERLLGRYLVPEKLGSGGFRSVYGAIDEYDETNLPDGEVLALGDRASSTVPFLLRSERIDTSYGTFVAGVQTILRGGRQRELGGPVGDRLSLFLEYHRVFALSNIESELINAGIRYQF